MDLKSWCALGFLALMLFAIFYGRDALMRWLRQRRRTGRPRCRSRK